MAAVMGRTGGVQVGARRSAPPAPVYRWELRRLLAQLRVRTLLVVCAATPPLFVAGIQVQPSVPADTLFGRGVHDSGYAVAFFLLGFSGLWGLPGIAAIVAGDLFSAEDRQGTWSLLLTRSQPRGSLVVAKLVAGATAAVAALGLLAVSSLLAGLVFVGAQPLRGLSGQPLTGTEATKVVLLAFGSTVPPLLTFVALAAALSAASRNGVVGIAGPLLIGLASSGLALVNLPLGLHLALPTSAFEGWHGLLTEPQHLSLLVIGSAVSLAWTVVLAGLAHRLVVRRDLAGS